MIRAESLAWPAPRAGEALAALARRAGLEPLAHELGAVPREPSGLGAWLDATAGHLGLELQAVRAPYRDVARLLSRGAPALLRLPSPDGGEDGERVLPVLRGRGRRITVLDRDLRPREVDAAELRDALCRPLEESLRPHVESVVAEAGVAPRRRARAAEALLGEHLAEADVGGCWLLRLPPGRNPWLAVRRTGLRRQLATIAGAHLLGTVLFLLSWYAVGRGALGGRLEPAWLLGWALLLASSIPLRLGISWTEGFLSLNVGTLLKRRLLQGALRMDPEETRHMGAGQLLGRVLESEAVESLALSAGLLAIGAAIELASALWVLTRGAGGALAAGLLLAWIGATLVLAWVYWRRNRAWTRARLDATHDLVERMVGHRTRVAQVAPERWHEGEDERLEHYLERSLALDRTGILLQGVLPSAWLIAGLACTAPALVAGGPRAAAVAVALGGVLLGQQALAKTIGSLTQLASLAVAWRQVAPLFQAAGKHDRPASVQALSLIHI